MDLFEILYFVSKNTKNSMILMAVVNGIYLTASKWIFSTAIVTSGSAWPTMPEQLAIFIWRR
jgi:hypothetical protein